MVGEIFAGIGAFKTIIDTVQVLREIDDRVKRNTVAFELTERIIAAQNKYAALSEDIGVLKAKIAQFEHWEATEQRYQLEPVGHTRVMAYVLKKDAEPSETPHEICPNCYSERRRSILQRETRVGRREFLVCHHCGLALNLSGGHEPTPTTISRGGTWGRSRFGGS